MVVGGGTITEGHAIVSADGKYLFSPSNQDVNIYNSATGKKSASLKGHKDVVTGIALHPQNTYQATCLIHERHL